MREPRNYTPTAPAKSTGPNQPPSHEDGRLEEQIRFLGDLARLDVKPGDRYVLMVPRALTAEMHDRIQQAWRRFIGSGDPEEMKLLILDGGIKIGALGQKCASPSAPPPPPPPARTEPPQWFGSKGAPPLSPNYFDRPAIADLFMEAIRDLRRAIRRWCS